MIVRYGLARLTSLLDCNPKFDEAKFYYSRYRAFRAGT